MIIKKHGKFLTNNNNNYSFRILIWRNNYEKFDNFRMEIIFNGETRITVIVCGLIVWNFL